MMRRRRSGFTLIELLVVIAIIAILVALLLPAVQSVREAARKAQCQDHLHNLGIAVMNYEGAHRVVPPVHVRGYRNPNEWGNGFSWGAMLLPFIEQKPLYDRLDFNVGMFMEPNKTVILNTAGISIALCPSDSERPPTRTAHSTANPNYMSSIPATSYFASTSAVNEWGTNSERRRSNGIFVTDPNVPVTIASIRDGTSNTIAIGEKSYQVWTGGSFLGMQSSTALPGEAADVASNPDWISAWGLIAPNAGYRVVSGELPTTPVNATNHGFSSPHPGGVQFVFMDGKVNMISENIDHTRSTERPDYATVMGGAVWDGTTGDIKANADYDDKASLAAKFGVYQRLHSRNDGLPLGSF